MATSTKTILPKEIFEVEIKNHDLLKRSYDAYLANGRRNLAKTLRRGEVRGGGRKPWRQKGTGRARFGSTRNPIWRTGGIVFGPLGNENYSKDMPKQAKRLAIKQALTLASTAGKIIVKDNIESNGKTKEFAATVATLGAKRNTLIAVDSKTPEITRASQNLQDVSVIQATYLNVYSILNADSIIITKAALEQITEWLGGEK